MNKLLTTICLIVGKEKRQYKCQHLSGTVYRYNSGICLGSAFFNIYANESFNLTELTSVWNYRSSRLEAADLQENTHAEVRFQ